MRGNHTRTQIPIQKRSARRVARHVLRKVQRRQRSTTRMITHTQLSTGRRQIQPKWCLHHVHSLSSEVRGDTNTRCTICQTLKPERHRTTLTILSARVTQAAIAALDHL